jgi:hypothetical protein
MEAAILLETGGIGIGFDGWRVPSGRDLGLAFRF